MFYVGYRPLLSDDVQKAVCGIPTRFITVMGNLDVRVRRVKNGVAQFSEYIKTTCKEEKGKLYIFNTPNEAPFRICRLRIISSLDGVQNNASYRNDTITFLLFQMIRRNIAHRAGVFGNGVSS